MLKSDNIFESNFYKKVIKHTITCNNTCADVPAYNIRYGYRQPLTANGSLMNIRDTLTHTRFS